MVQPKAPGLIGFLLDTKPKAPGLIGFLLHTSSLAFCLFSLGCEASQGLADIQVFRFGIFSAQGFALESPSATEYLHSARSEGGRERGREGGREGGRKRAIGKESERERARE